jgi:HEAT repeat protein
MKRITFVLTVLLTSTALFANNPDNNYQNTEKTLLEGLNSDNLGLQVSSAVMLGEIKSENSVNALTKALRNSDDTRLRKAAAQSLAKIGTERSLFVIKQAIRFDDDENVRTICTKLLQGSEKMKYESEQNSGNDFYAVK